MDRTNSEGCVLFITDGSDQQWWIFALYYWLTERIVTDLCSLLLMDRTNSDGSLLLITDGPDEQWRICALNYWWIGRTITDLCSLLLLDRTNSDGSVLFITDGPDEQWRICALYCWWIERTVTDLWSLLLMNRTNNEGTVLFITDGSDQQWGICAFYYWSTKQTTAVVTAVEHDGLHKSVPLLLQIGLCYLRLTVLKVTSDGVRDMQQVIILRSSEMWRCVCMCACVYQLFTYKTQRSCIMRFT